MGVDVCNQISSSDAIDFVTKLQIQTGPLFVCWMYFDLHIKRIKGRSQGDGELTTSVTYLITKYTAISAVPTQFIELFSFVACCGSLIHFLFLFSLLLAHH